MNRMVRSVDIPRAMGYWIDCLHTLGAWMALTRQQFEKTVISYGPTLRRVLLRLTHGRAGDADDLLQRTFERAWLKRETFIGGEVEPWVRGIARYEHLNHLRSRGQHFRLKKRAALHLKTEEPIKPPEIREENTPLKRCLSRLSELDRHIVSLFYGRLESSTKEVDPLTDREIGTHLSKEKDEDWSLDRIRTRRHRALKQLRRCLGSSHGGLS